MMEVKCSGNEMHPMHHIFFFFFFHAVFVHGTWFPPFAVALASQIENIASRPTTADELWYAARNLAKSSSLTEGRVNWRPSTEVQVRTYDRVHPVPRSRGLRYCCSGIPFFVLVLVLRSP